LNNKLRARGCGSDGYYRKGHHSAMEEDRQPLVGRSRETVGALLLRREFFYLFPEYRRIDFLAKHYSVMRLANCLVRSKH